MAQDPLVEEILLFWFGELGDEHDLDTAKMKMWWVGGPAVDDEIRERFGAAVKRALGGELDGWKETARGCLALVVLCDQFTRNLGRGTAAAFAGDDKALALCFEAIDGGFDRDLRPVERAFLYMPMMHAEDRAVARRSVQAFEQLSGDVAELGRDDYPDFASHAKTHASIVERFGRYPHRNLLLDRESSAEEEEFLEKGGPDFGQARKK
jgi:uncharacterized protein (DUF924 family)